MKTLTPNQRREIYLRVAEHLSSTPVLFFLCGYLKSMITHNDLDHNIYGNYYVGGGLTEFDLFQPDDGDATLWWLEDDQYGVRIICLLLCAEMCDSEKQLAYSEYINQCGNKPHVSFEQWEKHYDDGTEYLLDEDSAIRNGNREPNYERPGH